MPETVTVEHVDPSTLLLGVNIRKDPQMNDGFLASVQARGVHTPCPAVRTASGDLMLLFGSRRRAAAIAAGKTLPVFVVGDQDTSQQGQVDRLFDQFDENEQRTALTAQERAGFVQTLLDFKITATQIRKRTGMSKADVDQARTVAASERLMAGPPVEDLEMAAILANFDRAGDNEAVEQLTQAVQGGPGQFRHAAQQVTDTQAERFAKRDLLAELTAAGLTLLGEDENGDPVAADGKPVTWKQRLMELKAADGKHLTVENHADCPGHAAYLHRGSNWENGRYEYTWMPVYVCTDPEGRGHTEASTRSGGTQAPASDAQKEAAAKQRRVVLDCNKKWRSAQTVRQNWLRTELLNRTKAPADALSVIFGSLTGCWFDEWDHSLTNGNQHTLARDLLGLPSGASPGKDIATALREASVDRQQVIALGMVLAAWESRITDDTWRKYVRGIEQYRRGNFPSVEGRYLLLLQSWGYSLSDLETLPAAATQAAQETVRRGAEEV